MVLVELQLTEQMVLILYFQQLHLLGALAVEHTQPLVLMVVQAVAVVLMLALVVLELLIKGMQVAQDKPILTHTIKLVAVEAQVLLVAHGQEMSMALVVQA